MPESMKTTARCECGELSLEITGIAAVQLVCHCTPMQATFWRAG
jgi:hypothetical protein